MFLNCGVGEDSWEFLGLQGDQTSPFWRKSVLNILWKNWCWSTNPLATWCEELTHLKRPWCWEGLRAGREGDDRGWDSWMALPTQWTWVWVNSRSWWWTRRPGVLLSMGSQRVGHDWVTELNWTDLYKDLMEFLQVGLGQTSLSQGQACLRAAFFKKNYWSVVDLQCCVSFRCTEKGFSFIYLCVVCVCSISDSFPLYVITKH